MIDTINVKSIVRDFARQMSAGRLDLFAELAHGFEAWLKHELAHYAVLEAGVSKHDVIMETWIPMPDAPGMDKKAKLVDIAFTQGDGKMHAVEIKTVFHDYNRTKMATSAGWDLWYLKHAFLGGNANLGSVGLLVVGLGGVGDEASWKNETLKTVAEASEIAVETLESALSVTNTPSKNTWLDFFCFERF